MAKNNNVKDFTRDIADAIRIKKKKTEKINPQNFTDEILSITTGEYNISQVILNDDCELHITKATGTSEETVKYHCIAIDYDGTILKEEWLESGKNFIMPATPTHNGLVFQEWSSSSPISDNKVVVEDRDVLCGAVYGTTSGMSEFYITLNKGTGVTVTLNMDCVKHWGDGTTDSLTQHTYTTYGDYIISCEAGKPTDSYLFGQESNGFCREMHINGNNSLISSVRDAFVSLERVTLAKDFIDYVTTPFLNDARKLTVIVLPTSIKTLGASCFARKSGLKYVVIPYGVTEMNGRCFLQCTSLQEIIIPNTVTIIHDNMFDSCVSLKKITLSENTIELKKSCFTGCESLVSIDLPKGITTIGDGVFTGCRSLKKLVIPASVTTLGDIANCHILEELVFEAGPKEIGTIQGCLLLNKLYFSEAVQSVGEIKNCYNLSEIFTTETTNLTNGFSKCYGLKKIRYKNNDYISYSAFNNCYLLEEIIFLDNIYEIDEGAFSGATSLIKCDFSNCINVPTVYGTIFANINALCKIIVPDNLYDAWITTSGWTQLAGNIYKASEVRDD